MDIQGSPATIAIAIPIVLGVAASLASKKNTSNDNVKCGLENVGNKCYLNAVLQFIAPNDEYCGSVVRSRSEVRSEVAGRNSTTTAAEAISSSWLFELRRVFRNMRRESSVQRTLNLATFYNALQAPYNSSAQQSASELLQYILSATESNYVAVHIRVTPPKATSWRVHIGVKRRYALYARSA
jgi:ubiquitin C-terminal hydrolase